MNQILDHSGKIKKLGRLGLRRDRLAGFLQSLWRGRIDHFDDHSIHRYIAAIATAVAEENAQATTQPVNREPVNREAGSLPEPSAGPGSAVPPLSSSSPVAELACGMTDPLRRGQGHSPAPGETPTSNRPG